MIRRDSIRSRLVAALIAMVVVATGILAVGMLVMLKAERDFRELAQDRIPAVALAGELAEATGELAALGMQVVADPLVAADRMNRAIENASSTVAGVLASPVWSAEPGREATRGKLEAATHDLQRALKDFLRISARLDRRAQTEARAGTELRWVHADIQDQVQGILTDLSFNLDTQLAVLMAGSSIGPRSDAEQALSQDWLLRDRVQQLGSEAATLTALLLQAQSANSSDSLEQTRALGRDTLDQLSLGQLNLAPRVDVVLLIEALERLKELATGGDGIFAQVQQRLDLHRAAVTRLQMAQDVLAEMQALLTDMGRAERVWAQRGADAAATAILQGSLWLGIVTLLGAMATAVILAVFVHQRILVRIEALSRDLIRIARGTSELPEPVSGNRQRDEIEEMAAAVEVFRASIQERRQAVERLEATQRELVQVGKMAALGQMSAAISHEINQPLAAIGHRLHNLRATHPDAGLPIQRIEGLLERITRTISHLRRIARRSAHQNSCVVLAEPLNAALELLDHRLRNEGVRIECADLAGVKVSADEILLEQVLLNVLGNALDAIEAREGASEEGLIHIDVRGSNPVELVIRDNGVGLGGQSGQSLIDPFVTTKEVGKGLGLGLSIAFNVMQDMDGNLEIEQHDGGGAEVRLRLNRWKTEERHA
ncbi:HAMP domain-containing protein [Paracoccus sediminis]|uniref:histidine kinase n=1 Tax=Paracoccus sediminis TaxID=1214787 RepID=A0A238YAH2_9RHOB|nr:ATP-binding protein [Paracoccus sediminis]TBN46983.1 HAMP domain-containing protein [Paracoccus sediminis]SNR67808.1 His Kinase A (phospho-acceptor) domain-containing protein [Paracoccus sediminis]